MPSGIGVEDAMNKLTKEIALAELVENPGLGLAMEYEGVEHRAIELLLERRLPRPERRPSPRPAHPLAA
jgi:hypothetical protein